MVSKKRTLFIAFLCALLLSAIALFLPVFVAGTDTASAANIKDTNVEYKSVDKIIKIDENKSLDITEIIKVGFRKSGINVGLSRNVSRLNKITRIVNGKKYVNTTKNDLQLISVTLNGEEEYSFVEERGDYFYINTGADGDYKKADFYVYEIHYRYDMSYDFIKSFDDFTFDIMDYGFRGAVEKFSAQITLPKDFLGGKQINDVLTFRTNDMAPLGYEAVNMEFSEEDLTISCSYEGFATEHGLTMQLILPQGYFTNSYTPNTFYWLTLAATVVAAVAIAVIIVTSRVVRNSVVTTEFYPPDGYSPLDVARSYRGYINGKDFAALIISWAGKGLVSIEIKGKKHIILTKLKAYEYKNVTPYSAHECDFFNRLFGFSTIYDTKSEKRIISTDKTELYKTVKALYKPGAEQKRELVLKKVAISVLAVVPFIMCTLWNDMFMGNYSALLFMLIFPLIALNVFIYFPMPLWFKIIWCCFFGGVPFIALVWNTYSVYDIYCLSYLTGALFILGTMSSVLVRSFSKEGKLMHGKVLGFKKFLALAELNKLNALLEDDPDYFYNILPYCYVFGITKKMEKKFAALHVTLPEYFNGGTVSSVGHCISHSMSSVCGGGSVGSGGGSGGGGGGGGGGGSSGGGGGGGGCGGR